MGCCVRHALINIKLSVKCMLKHGHKCSEATSSKEMEGTVFMLDGAMGAKGTFRSTRGMLSQTKPQHFVQTFEDFQYGTNFAVADSHYSHILFFAPIFPS